MKLIFQISELN